jgi:hypothetical protein
MSSKSVKKATSPVNVKATKAVKSTALTVIPVEPKAEKAAKPVKLVGATFYGITITGDAAPASSVFSKNPNVITGQPKTEFKSFSNRSNLMIDALKKRFSTHAFDGKYCDQSIADNAIKAGFLELNASNQLRFTKLGLSTRFDTHGCNINVTK